MNAEKNEEAQKTDEFVRERLANIDAELGQSDSAWEKSKKNFQITDPKVDAQEIIEKKSLYETQLVSIGVQLQLQDYLKVFVDNLDNLFELIPVNVGMTDENIPTSGDALPMISRHNTLVNQRKDLLKIMSEQAPQVQRLTETICELHPSIQTAILRDRESILIRRNNVEREYSKYMERVSNTPQMERVLTDIGRQREIKQGVYLLLLQKREETAMELANITDKGRLIDEIRMIKNSKHPKKMIVLLAALVMGIIFPVPFLFFRLTLKPEYRNASLVLLSLMMFSSCISTKNVPYFINMDEVESNISKGLYDAKIMPKDILQIKVFSVTPGSSESFNLEKSLNVNSISDATNLNSVYNYFVDNDGNIVFPVVGTIQLGGLTQNEAENLIKSKIAPYMSVTEDFLVHVRMINYKYSVLGEVRRPGTFNAPNEKVNILEAIANAGDLTLYGMRDKVYLIREDSEGRKEFHRLNLNDANIISSPYYYLQQNDIIYVEPNKAQARSSYFSTTSSIWMSIASTLISLSTLIIAITK